MMILRRILVLSVWCPILQAAMSETRNQVFVRHVSPRLKRALLRKVRADGGNMNDVAVGIIADKVGYRYQPNGRRSSGLSTDGGDMVLYMPARLHKKLKLRALHADTDVGSLIRDTLTEVLL